MDKNKELWNKVYANAYNRPRYPNEHLVAFAMKNFPRGGGILDLCCGSGRHLKFLAENGFKAYGCDVSEEGVFHAKEMLKEYHLQGEVLVASMEKIPFESDFFDGLFSIGSLMYGTKEQIQSNAKEIYRVLKKGAKAYLNLRSVLDYRHINGKVISKYEVIVDEKDSSRPAYGENGMRVYHFDEEEVRRIYADFSHLTCDTIRHSFENNAYANDNLIVVLTK